MNITELDQYNLRDAVRFHNRLNPRLWGSDEHLHPEVRQALLAIADDFRTFLGVPTLKIKDITVSGSNAAYNYTPHSDIDLHLVVEFPEENADIYQELFNAKKYQYNDQHHITIGDSDVELYVQPANETQVSQGVYSVRDDQWLSVPRRKRAKIDDMSVRHKYEDLVARIKAASDSQDLNAIDSLIKKIKIMRGTALEENGEFSTENLAFKMLRAQGYIEQLYQARNLAHDRLLSIDEDAYSTPDGVAPTTCMFLNEEPDNSSYHEFFDYVVERLGITMIPEFVIHDNPDWSKINGSFGRYDPDTHTLEISTVGRHPMDIFRTMAHELTHARQNELGELDHDSGETGSDEENQANALAGEIMRDWGQANPDMFAHDSHAVELKEQPQTQSHEYYDQLAQKYAKEHGVPISMVRHVMNRETGHIQDPAQRAQAQSKRGAQGIMQLKPITQREMGVTDPHDPEQNIRGGVQYLGKQLQRFKDPVLAMAAYNAGPANVDKYGGVPPFKQTQGYVSGYQPDPIKPMPEPVQPGFLDTVAAKGREWASSAADVINRVTAPPQQFRGAFGAPAEQPVREARPRPYPEPEHPPDPDITPMRDRLRQGDRPADIARDKAAEVSQEIERREALRQQLEQEKANLERQLQNMKKQPEPQQQAWYQTVVDLINRLTAPPKPFPNAFGSQLEPTKEDQSAPVGDSEPSIERGLNFLRQLHGITKITRAGAEEELRGAVKDYAQGPAQDAMKKILRPVPAQEPVKENASGYIPTTREKNDPRYQMALTQDIRPGELGRQANKMSLKTDSRGRPALLRSSGKV